MNKGKSKVWVKLFEECEKSGLSQSEFCKDRGLKLSSFYGWKAKLKKQGLLSETKDQADKNNVSKAKPNRFVEAVVPGTPDLSPEPKPLTLKVNEQYCLELESGFDETLLLRTLKILGKL